MSVARIPASGGLAPDVSAIIDPKLLRTAANVMMHRPGIIQSRFGIGDTTGIAARSVARRPIALAMKGSSVVVQSKDGSTYSLERGSTTTVYSTTVAPVNVELSPRSAFMEARGSLYIATSTGVQKLDTISATALTRAGLPTTYMSPVPFFSADVGANSDRAAIGSGKCAAYRYVFKRTDTNGYTLRSAPSSRNVARVAAAAFANGIYVTLANNATHPIHLPSEIIAGDEIEVYRTRNASPDTADPGEDYYLATTYVITSADVTATRVSTGIVDDTLDGQLGAALYASASQYGLESSKEIPPIAMLSLTWWNHCAWMGLIQERRALGMELQQVAYRSGATVRLEGQGLCFLKNGTYAGTSGNKITGVSFAGTPGLGWDALAFGQWVTDAVEPGEASAGRIAAGATITAFDSGAATITLSVAPSGTGAFWCGDSVTVRAEVFNGSESEKLTTRRFQIYQSSTDLSERCRVTAESLARCISYQGAVGTLAVYAYKDSDGRALFGVAGSVVGNGQFLLLTARPENTGLTFTCSMRGGAFAPDATTQINSISAQRDGAIAWSAPDEPEAWPPLNTANVGDPKQNVLALVPLRQSLLVWKADGLYRVTGYPPNSWQIDEVDTQLRLLHPNCTAVLRNVCYAWTDRGIVAVSDLGLPQVISTPIAGELRTIQTYVANEDPALSYQMIAHERFGYVSLMTGTTTDLVGSTLQWVFHVDTGRWSQWTRNDRCMVYDSLGDKMIASPYVDGWRVFNERNAGNAGLNYHDAALTGLIASVAGAVVTIATTEFTVFTPAIGDVIKMAGLYRRITAVATVGGDYTLTVDSTGLSGTSADWFQGYTCGLLWQASQLPGVGARWGEMHLHFGLAKSQYAATIPLTIGGQTEREASPVTVAHAMTPTSEPRAGVVRIGPPRDIVRAARLYPSLTWRGAGVNMALEALDMHYTATGRRIAR